LQHIGSDDSVWRGAPPGEGMQRMRQAVANLENAANRPQDVSFTIDQLEKLNHETGELKGHLDLKRLGVGGHSFGAFTALAIAGQKFGGQQGNISCADPRVKAVIPTSAPVTPIQARLESAYDAIKIPCFHMTGAEDSSPIGETRPQDRRIPFDRCHNSDQFLVTLTGGDHMIFSGRGRMAAGEKDALFQRYIRMSSIAFWDAYLKQNKKANEWLTGTGFEKILGTEGKFEKKLH
jgi:predicted dienelactone hydrolase